MSVFSESRGGHAPGHIREAFLEGVESQLHTDPVRAFGDPGRISFKQPAMQQQWLDMTDAERAAWLITQLCNCTDVMPCCIADILDLPAGTTYGRAARLVRGQLNKLCRERRRS